MGNFNVAQRIDVRDKCANIDALYGPFNSKEEALAAVPVNRRAIGRTVAIIEDGAAVEYWFKGGITDEDLVPKIQENIPKLEYTEDYPKGTILRADVGESLTVSVKFSSQSYGQCTLSIYRDGSLIKTMRTQKGIILVDLGAAATEGTSVYTITGVDALTIPAEETLEFKAVIGGARISSDFQDVLDAGVNTETNLRVLYNASVADSSKAVKVYGEVVNANGDVVASHHNQGSGSAINVLSGQEWEIGVLGTPDNYTLRLYAYTGDTPDDTSGDNVTSNVVYTFELMMPNAFRMSSTTAQIEVDSNTSIVIPFRIYSGTKLTLQAHGELYNEQGVIVPEFTLNRSVTSDVRNYWAIGKLRTPGTYTLRMWATTVGGEDSPDGRTYVIIPATISQYVPQYNISTNGLVGQFLADGKSNNNDADKRGIWENTVSGSRVYFQLTDLNYNTNGWKHVDESRPDSDPDGEMMLKMTGDSYGRLKQMAGSAPADTDPDYLPMANLNSSASTGFTAEVIFRTRCIGELDTKVITGHTGQGTNTSGFSASFDTITVGSDGAQVRLDVAEEEWIHATMVIDKTVHTNVDDVQDYAPTKLMTLYINGSACAATILTDNMEFTNYGPVILNAALNTAYNRVDFFGSCEIKAIRFYNRPLYASEVENNYIASIYDEEEQSRIAGRNGDVLPIVRFIRNGDNDTTFEQLNRVTQKSMQKLVFVYSRVLYEPVEGDRIEWPYVKILTQGTSSLLFPVKNYKIELYTDNTYKTKASTSAFTSLGWKKEKKFTLKCDYMEAAHLNNTPSCTFYNNMIDSLVDSENIATGWNEEGTIYTAANDQRSPSRRDGMFDAIKGFPCLVYYYESEEDYANGNGVYVGSYMFNIDKSGKSLGFDAPAKLDENGETVIEIDNPRFDTSLYSAFSDTVNYSEGDRVVYNGVAYIALEDMEAGAWDATKWEAVSETVENICQSFEGVANGSDTAGCFYSYEDWKTSHYAEYCATAYNYFKEEHPSSEMELDEFIQYYSIDHPDTKYRAGEEKEGFFNDGGYLYQKNPFITAEHKFDSEYAYFASDFETRYDWDDLEGGESEFWGNSTWGLKRMIDWVSSRSATAGTDNDVFKSEFNDYFNFSYCALYYLQMIVFGQVDNAGKNSMWDTWDGLHWMPRPYDLDTMAGLNNTGYELVDPDAELNPILSPFRLYNATGGTAAYSEDVSTEAGSRYLAYNTRNSKFWIAFAKSFKSEIENLYTVLRDGDIYSIDYITRFFKSMTSDIIGEVYYNRDMATKFYKLADINTFIDRMHGNRVQRFKAWMSKRITFCDSLFGYSSATKSLNNIISLRSDAASGTETVSVSVGIRVYSPQYVRFEVGSGRDAIVEAYCSPTARYIDPITGEEQEGTLFTLPVPGGNKEMSISGAGNVKSFVNLSALKASSLVLNYAERLNNLDLAYSTKLTSLSLARNKYLQSLDCTGATKLGTDAAGAQLDLSNCENLKYVTLDNTKLTSIVFATGGSLKSISLRNTTITAVQLDSLHFLTSIDVTNCQNIISYSITNCPKIQAIEANDLPLNSIAISDCAGLESIALRSDNNISSISITRCPYINTLDFSNSRSASLSTLDLTTLYGLNTLSITGSTVQTIKFPKNESATSSVPWGAGFYNFNMTGSGIKYIQYGETPSSSVDMSQLTALSSVSFSGCAAVQHITNLTYTGNCSNLFLNCTSLLDITGRLMCIGAASSLFSSCYVLSDISGLTFDFGECTHLNNAFYRCPWITYAEVKRVLDSCGTKLTDISSICYDKGYGVTYTSAQTAYTQIPAFFFGNCKKVQNISFAIYSAKLTLITGNAFTDENGHNGLVLCKNAQCAFANNSGLTAFPLDIIKRLPIVTNVAGLFRGCSSIVNTLTSDFFENNTEDGSMITDVNGMFYGCSNLNVNMTNMANLMAPLTRLHTAHLMFGACTKCIGNVPEGFFSHNTSLTNIAGFFRDTRITGIPASGSLFRANGDSTSNITSLTDICSLFDGCVNLTTTPNANLFAGAQMVTAAGQKTQYYGNGWDYVSLRGMFYGCLRITSFSKDLFDTIPLVQNLSGFFYGCSGIVSQTGGGFDGDILSGLTNLTNVGDMFRGCTSLSIANVPQLFVGSKQKLTNASALFYGCTGISDFDAGLFANMTKLTNASYVFYGCISLSTQMTSILPFAGCTALQTVAYAFGGCTSISGSIPVGLFNSCRSTIENTEHMFDGCIGLDGSIGTGNENTVSPDSELFQPGLLAECLSLKTTAYMFAGCNHMSGSVPWDMFWTRNTELLYNLLTDIRFTFYNCRFTSGITEDGETYLFHPDMFIKLIGVTTMRSLFARPGNAIWAWPASYQVHANAFDGQYFLTDIREMFYNCNGLGGAVPNRWFANSISSLADAYGAFAHTRITDVGATFLRANSTTANSKLAYVSKMFYNDNAITGNLPPMNNTALYRRIDYSNENQGFLGYAYNCTNAANYNDFVDAEGKWIRNMNY